MSIFLEKVLLKASDDALWKCYNSCSQEAMIMDRSFWQRRFIQEFGAEKGAILCNHPYEDLGKYYFHKKYYQFRNHISNVIPGIPFPINVASVAGAVNQIHYSRTNFNIMARIRYECMYVKIQPLNQLNQYGVNRNPIKIILRTNGSYTIEGCYTQNEIDELTCLLKGAIINALSALSQSPLSLSQ